ncbi:unnamed protein product [Timema podura]|uniref:Uncharacterized protein n=1 Tax=Timema podura TaxID=61482 RepID=A0ABN7PLD2_TIMPD|nr:unnamed protein product [Timema podura]
MRTPGSSCLLVGWLLITPTPTLTPPGLETSLGQRSSERRGSKT